MTLNKGKHIVAEIQGVRCTVVESGISKERMQFLKELLEYNSYEVKTDLQKKTAENELDTFIIGVTDLVFNPVIDIYKRRLKTKTGHKVTPAYWLQQSFAETEAEVNYWNFK